ncbi:PGPGW domain-containing protein [Thalassomonas viridans]|uniref:PGPGW domain-containing protein n=1 Tax=Thalassomonas viridans TaxID=137584 RepID=A0AAE9Z1I0_9GAMM|nr:PGPGW domain-containing protein [Thalassomonas viridans]WDE04915.1 PGPGW domain-containing protein [Thalassomonas viridans]
MQTRIKKWLITLAGFFCLLIGAVFILLPGPAVVFIPAGLALLSLEYPLAKTWLRKSQRWLAAGARETDRVFLALKRRWVRRRSG